MNSNIPYIHCYVNGKFIGVEGWEECYVFAVTTLLNRPLLFTAHLESGAVYSRLPLVAFSPIPEGHKMDKRDCDPWGSISPVNQVIRFDYLKDYAVLRNRENPEDTEGRYLFSIDAISEGYAEDPEQHKILHVVEFDDHYAALPNNMIHFPDTHFTTKIRRYKRNTKYFEI